jgi:bisphosphoglycerate-independent phosphoglycerate mutase (AlkP superfamily)
LRDLNRPERLWTSYFRDIEYKLTGDEFIARTAVSHFQEGGSDFTFVYFGTIDLSGHMSGWMSEAYIRQAEAVDGLMGRVLEAIGPGRSVIIQSDHGGHERNHGSDSPEDMTIFWTVGGPGVRAGHVIERDVSLLDTAPTIVHLLKRQIPEEWEGSVPEEIFAPT